VLSSPFEKQDRVSEKERQDEENKNGFLLFCKAEDGIQSGKEFSHLLWVPSVREARKGDFEIPGAAGIFFWRDDPGSGGEPTDTP